MNEVNPMADLVTNLQQAISTNTMMTNLATLIPFIGGVVIFAFTYRLVKRAVSGASKGKAKI